MIQDVREVGDIAIASLSGRFDASAASKIKEDLVSLIEGGKTKIVLNLADVTFIDSSGLGVLVSCLRRLTSIGGDLKLASVPSLTRSIFELTRLSRVFDVNDDEAAAIEKLKGD